MATKMKEAAGAVERILLPRLNSIDGELKSINTKIDSSKSELRAEIKVVDTRVTEMDKRLTTRIDSLSERLTTRIDSLSEKFDMVKDIEKLKVEVAELKRRR
jgi:chromosome segregation ATPase